MKNAGFKGIAKRLCVGHAYGTPVKWNCEVEVFGCPVKPGELVHADRHGFLVIPKEDQEKLLEAVTFMDYNECNTVIVAARSSTGESVEEVLSSIDRASALFNEAMEEKMKNRGEW